eukprot:3277191-Alexandrium_andersonii.AAC.1
MGARPLGSGTPPSQTGTFGRDHSEPPSGASSSERLALPLSGPSFPPDAPSGQGAQGGTGAAPGRRGPGIPRSRRRAAPAGHA